VTWGDGFSPSTDRCVVHATVLRLWASGDGFRVILVENGWDDKTDAYLPGLGRLTVRQNATPLYAGDRISFRTSLRKPINRGNPGEYDWETDCRHNGIIWLASVEGEDSVVVASRGARWTPNAIVFRVRVAMDQFLEHNSGKILGTYSERFSNSGTPKQVRGFLKGIVLGDMGGIDHALQKSFSDSGLAHVLSASGLHVGIVVIVSLFAIRVATYFVPGMLLWIPFSKLGALASIPAIVFYCFLVGARVPAVRSGIMGVVIALALLLDRRWNSANSLALAALIILLMNPLSLFTPSFQLSFGAMAGIFVVVPDFMKSARARNGQEGSGGQTDSSSSRRVTFYLSLVVVTSIAATLPITPFLLQTFHSLPMWTIPANLVTDFALTPALAFGLLGPAVGLIFPSAGAWILAIADLMSWFIIEVSFFFANLPGSVIRIPNMYPGEFLLCFVAALLLIWFVRNPEKKRLWIPAMSGLVLVLLICSLRFRHENNEFKVVFLNVGKGDASFASAPDTRGMLIDGGIMNQYFDAGKSIVRPFLDWAGVQSLDRVLISHPQMDHMGGVLHVVERVGVAGILWNPIGKAPPHLRSIFNLAGQDKVFEVHRNIRPLKLGNAVVTFLGKPWSGEDRPSGRDVNNASVVARIDYGNASFLFTGDLERGGEEELLASGLPVSATVLKVAHHGGDTSSSMSFLKAVSPRIAVISADYPSTVRVPNPMVLERLRSVGADVFITGRDGAITVETDGSTIYVTTGRQYGDGPRMVRKAYR
ncbi:MAG: DNA internalization-related competence protein ComEC/Rec2, partial [Desulfomonile tiedjei]|nr:DNA internalization-related competence protein ComEC/Rec2 [Desulfomonile tiedjei]